VYTVKYIVLVTLLQEQNYATAIKDTVARIGASTVPSLREKNLYKSLSMVQLSMNYLVWGPTTQDGEEM